jgi:hypothetical protein
MTKRDMKEPKTEQADYYQAHEDDPNPWGEPVPPPKRTRGRPSQGRGARISVRFTPEEMAGIRAQSEEEGITYSEVVRRAVNDERLKVRRPEGRT